MVCAFLSFFADRELGSILHRSDLSLHRSGVTKRGIARCYIGVELGTLFRHVGSTITHV